MLSDVLIPMLKERFPGRVNIIGGKRPQPCAVFPAIHPEVGDVEIYDDDDEITLVAGNFTHGHFSCYDYETEEEKEKEIADDVVYFLDRLFADEVILWGSNKKGGGWKVFGPDPLPEREHDVEYLWSGPRKS